MPKGFLEVDTYVFQRLTGRLISLLVEVDEFLRVVFQTLHLRGRQRTYGQYAAFGLHAVNHFQLFVVAGVPAA